MRLVSAFICLVINLHAGPLKIEGQPRTFNTDAGQFTTSGKFVQRVPYKVGLVNWEVFLDPFQAAYITPGSASEDILNNLLETTFGSTNGIPNWYLGIPLGPTSDDSIVVRTYEAVHFPLGNCPGPCAGGRIQVDFVPHGTDNLLSNFHWVQIVTSNHAVGAPHGTPEMKIDVSPRGGGRSPYYDDRSQVSGPFFFFDQSAREDHNEHRWTAELFLVTGPAPDSGGGEINVLGGVKWGWVNRPAIPEPGTGSLVGLALAAVWIIRRRAARAK